jgi:hypothetical protein
MNMRLKAAIAVLLGAAAFGQTAEPTTQEIEQAYRSKLGGGGIAGLRWERWRTKEIRGWSLKFKRLSEKRAPGVMFLEYQAFARKNGSCAEYRIVETLLTAPPNPQIRPGLAVEPEGVKACR